tara:strand:+ start:408 stop:761 length:354 start_codon:yes stop_codon:yes gene_type:complete
MSDYTNDIDNVINESLSNDKHWFNMSNNSHPNYVKYIEGKFPLENELTLLKTKQLNPLICNFRDKNGNIITYKLVTDTKHDNYYIRQLIKKMATKITELENRVKDLETYQAAEETTV